MFLYILYQIDKGLIEMEESESIVLGAGKLLTIWKVQTVTQVLNYGIGAVYGLLLWIPVLVITLIIVTIKNGRNE